MIDEGRAVVHGRVLRTVGGVYVVDVEGEDLECVLRGRLKLDREIGRVAVGDEVEVEVLPDGTCAITGVEARRSVFARRPGRGRRQQIIAANVDRMAAVFAVTEPDPRLPLLDRFLVLAESRHVPAFIVANKVDLAEGESSLEPFRIYERAGYDVLRTSAKTERGIDELRDRLAGHATLFVGPSGAGKSSLLNALQPELGLRVGEVSRVLRSGRHTTVQASAHRAAGGYVVDTPGLQRLRFSEIAEEELDRCFPEFREFLGLCKFPDCRHVKEPGCEVVSAVERGAIARSRYESYVLILEEREAEDPYR